jgi:hypothetical protein
MTVKKKPKYNLGQRLIIREDMCFSFPTEHVMKLGHVIEEVISIVEKWNNKWIRLSDAEVAEFSSDTELLVPDELRIRNTNDCVFDISGFNVVYIKLLPKASFEIYEVVEGNGKPFYSIFINGEVIKELSEGQIDRMVGLW